MQDDAVKTPETPRWFGTGYNADHLTTETGHYVYTPTQSVEDSHRVKHRLEHLEAALREAEAKAALADDMRWALAAMLLACPVNEGGDAHRTAEELIARHDALQQPKPVTHRQADRHGDGFGN